MSGWPQSAPGVPPGMDQAPRPQTYAHVANPAFTPVQVRQGFGQYISQPAPAYSGHASSSAAVNTPPTHTGSGSEQPKGKTEWPPKVRSYVQRAFFPENNDPSVSRSELEAKLKDTIGTAKHNGTLETIDWDTVPLPQALVRADREELMKRTANLMTDARFISAESPSRKRKSSEHESPPPWQTTNPRSLDSRVSFPDNRDAPSTASRPSKFQKEADKRKRRFETEYRAHKSPSPPPAAANLGPIVGTSEVLEKRYLRLTAPAVASNVRPERVLQQTLDLLKKKWRKDGNYSYICDQFKSMRQDLTVQRIKNRFTVSVYEIHARIALEKGDLGEYNQCQTQLKSLYRSGAKGNEIEFKAYRILYFIHTANRTGLNDTLADLTPAEKEEAPIKHAMNVRSALALGNYHKFFKLYMDTPNMGAYIMDMFITRERLAALANICKAYKPDVELRFITEELAFESDTEAAQFIIDHEGQHLLDDRSETIAFLTGKAGAHFQNARAAAFRTVDIKGQI